MKKIFVLLFFILFTSIWADYTKKVYENYVIYEVQGKYSDIIFTLLDELSQDGFILSYRANIADAMEGLTKFHKRKALFKNAEKIGFCKVSLTLEMMDENPNNLMFCPLSIALYEENKKNSNTKIIYRIEKNLSKDEKIMDKVNSTILRLIENSLE